MRRILLFVVVAFICVIIVAAGTAHAFTFSLQPGSTKCFTDELTQSHRIHLDWTMSRARAILTSVHITDPNGKQIFDEKKNTHSGHFVFHPASPGEHAVCFTSSERRSPVESFTITFTLLAEFEVQTQRSLDYLSHAAQHASQTTASSSNQKNKALMVQAKYASENLNAIHEEYRSFMDREARMRITTESAFTRSNVTSFMSVLIIGAVCFFGYLTLKRHLVKLKLLE